MYCGEINYFFKWEPFFHFWILIWVTFFKVVLYNEQYITLKKLFYNITIIMTTDEYLVM